MGARIAVNRRRVVGHATLLRPGTPRRGGVAVHGICAATDTFSSGILIHIGFNLGLIMRHLIGIGTPRGRQECCAIVIATLLTLKECKEPTVT
jgi:hypothetical protein